MKWYQRMWVKVLAFSLGLVALILSIPVIGNLFTVWCNSVDGWFK